VKVVETALPGVLIIEPTVHGDGRGFFLETFHAERYRREAGIELPFVQDNHSRSSRGVLRGLHAQRQHPQGKLVRVTRGEVFDAVVDIRRGSPTFGQWTGVTLSDSNHRQFWVPPGFAHGFVVLSETADFVYRCTDYYHPEDEIGLLWNDTEVAIDWPVAEPLLNARDRKLPTLAQLRALP
jgi:dTDP-4-dehydrorhamnose 3,5-epimerase